ncbi:MAG: hypothetical protein JF606_13125 [Burkholderiales bacterium]|jgi:hypothetical protein|nr:hypothetical protein [Burkholderiales bacterium]
MTTFRTILRSAVAGALLVFGTASMAVALRPGKTTDASVCDLGHNTNGYFGAKMLVPAAAAPKDQVDAFFRMASGFIATNCSNGQVLILQGSADVDVDSPSLLQVANSSCMAANVKRTEGTAARGDYTYPTFELRCTILKHSELIKQLAELERTDSMEALKGRLVRSVQETSGTSTSSMPGQQPRRTAAR